MNEKLTFFTIVLAISLFSCVDNSQLNLKAEPIEGAKHLGQGVWLSIPAAYKKAKSFEGFQAPNNESSISLQVNRATLDQVRKSFDKKRLSKKGVKLLSLRPVAFGEVDSALYSIVEDNRKKTRRYTLSIKKNDQIYSIKAFSFQELASKYEAQIEKSLFSAYFGEVEIEVVPFTIAKLNSTDNYVMTRDGKYPTESKDKAVIEIQTLEDDSSSKDRTWQLEYLTKQLEKQTKSIATGVRSEKLANGTFNSGLIKEGDLKCYGAFLTSLGNKDLLIIGKSYSTEALAEFEEFIRFTLLKTSIGSR